MAAGTDAGANPMEYGNRETDGGNLKTGRDSHQMKKLSNERFVARWPQAGNANERGYRLTPVKSRHP